jgi:hypothetical protein
MALLMSCLPELLPQFTGIAAVESTSRGCPAGEIAEDTRLRAV